MRRISTLFIVLTLFSAPAFSQKKDTYKVRTIVIDAGHGGAKPGAIGSRTQEKQITLSIAKKFGQLIADNYPDVKVIYTRTTDVDISLAERAHIANRNKADLFVSIHANSHPTSNPTGVETFVMGLSESRANLEVAKKENADILLEADYQNNEAYNGFDPNSPESYVMLAMFQNAFIDKSLNFAQAIQNQYKQNLRTIDRGVKQAELFVLYKTTCPSVLTEVGFISNPREESFMISDEGQAKIALSLFNAFMNYKATEEGSDKIANPKINLKGYEPQMMEKKEPEVKQTDTVVVVEVVKVVDTVVVAPVVAEKITAPERPLPSRELAPRMQIDPEVVPPPSARGTEVIPETSVVLEKSEISETQVVTPVVDPVVAPAIVPVVAPVPVAKPEAKPAPAKAPAGLAAPNNSAAANAKEFFTVQFLTSKEELKRDNPAFKGISEVMTSRNGSLYVYSVGRFATFKEANEYCKSVQEHTSYKDAWAVRRLASAVMTEKPAAPVDKPAAPAQPVAQATSQAAKTVSAPSTEAKPEARTKPETKAKPEVKPQEKPQAATEKGTFYRVQFSTSTRVLQTGDPDLHGIRDFRYSKSGKAYVYTAGNYTTLAEAKQRCATIQRTTPFKDAFVVCYKNGKRVPIQ